MSNNLTNEQKLDEIYTIMRAMERRQMQASIARIVKWLIILGAVAFVAANPKMIIGKITEYVKPIVMDQVKTMTDELNAKLLQGAKGAIQN